MPPASAATLGMSQPEGEKAEYNAPAKKAAHRDPLNRRTSANSVTEPRQ